MAGTVTIPNGNTSEHSNSLTQPSGTVIPTLSGSNTIVINNYKTVNATGGAGNPGTVAVTVDISSMPAGLGVKYAIFVDGTAVDDAIITASGSFNHTVTGRSRTNPVEVKVGWGIAGSPHTMGSAGTIILRVTGSDYGF